MVFGLFSNYAVYYILVFVLVFSVVYGILSRYRIFDKSDIIALIAVSVAAIALVSSVFVAFIVAFIPYVLAIVLFIFLVLLGYMSALGPTESVSAYVKKSVLVPGLIIFLLFIFGFIAYGAAASTVNSGSSSPSATTQPSGGSPPSGGSAPSGPVARYSFSDISGQYIIAILTNPSVLSLLLTMFAMAIGVYFMTRDEPRH